MGQEINRTEEAAGRTVFLGGAEYLFFSGTSYLGMHRNETFRKFLLEGLEKYGSSYGSSRVSNLQLAIYGEAEEWLANWLGMETCTLLSSGFMAGQLLVRTLEASGAQTHYAPGVHPALFTGEQAFQEASREEVSWEEWSGKLLLKINAARGEQVILAGSIDPLRSFKYDFSFLEKIAPGKNITLVVDDSHGFGVLGRTGEGIVNILPRKTGLDVIILGSLGKGLGIPAGAVWGTGALAEQLRGSPLFIGASPPAPAYLYAFLKAGRLYLEARQRLTENTAYFESLVKELKSIRHAPGLPVFLLEDESAAGRLMEQRIFLSSFPYPQAGSKPVSRIVLSSLHTREDLGKLAGALIKLRPHRFLKDCFRD